MRRNSGVAGWAAARGGHLAIPFSVCLISSYVLAVFGPSFCDIIVNPSIPTPDFFQEYASARNFASGEPLYMEHALSVPRYLQRDFSADQMLVEVNAHPPAAVAIAIPFSRIPFGEAFALWNIISLNLLGLSAWLIQRNLGFKLLIWHVVPGLALLLLFDPLRQHFVQGQLGLLLFTLVIGAWTAERSGRPAVAGLLIGVSGALKLFPCYLFALFLFRKQWRALACGIAAFAAVNVACGLLFGFGVFNTYVTEVVPRFQHFRAGWNNFSIWGLASKLFDPAPEKERVYFLTSPLLQNALLARVVAIAAMSAVTVRLWALLRRRVRGPDPDGSYAAAVTAMVLVAPIVWEHYFVILILPIAIHAFSLMRSGRPLWPFALMVAPLWISPGLIWLYLVPWGAVAQPWQVVGPLSLQLYSVILLFVVTSRPDPDRAPVSRGR